MILWRGSVVDSCVWRARFSERRILVVCHGVLNCVADRALSDLQVYLIGSVSMLSSRWKSSKIDLNSIYFYRYDISNFDGATVETLSQRKEGERWSERNQICVLCIQVSLTSNS
jgi:hypothetical protein